MYLSSIFLKLIGRLKMALNSFDWTLMNLTVADCHWQLHELGAF